MLQLFTPNRNISTRPQLITQTNPGVPASWRVNEHLRRREEDAGEGREGCVSVAEYVCLLLNMRVRYRISMSVFEWF